MVFQALLGSMLCKSRLTFLNFCEILAVNKSEFGAWQSAVSWEKGKALFVLKKHTSEQMVRVKRDLRYIISTLLNSVCDACANIVSIFDHIQLHWLADLLQVSTTRTTSISKSKRRGAWNICTLLRSAFLWLSSKEDKTSQSIMKNYGLLFRYSTYSWMCVSRV